MKRNFAFWLIILILLLALFSAFKGPSGGDGRQDISYSEFLAGVNAGNITSVTIQENNIAGQMSNGQTFKLMPQMMPPLLIS
jgi:cell division protease FtsH